MEYGRPVGRTIVCRNLKKIIGYKIQGGSMPFNWYSCSLLNGGTKYCLEIGAQHSNGQIQRLCTGPESTRPELLGENAYQILGVDQSSSLEEIKLSFRKLAKETHPDLVGSTSESSYRFIQILAAYEILSDSSKRAHYDYHLLCLRKFMKNQNNSANGSSIRTRKLHAKYSRGTEVVEWLKWYRLTINEMVSEERVVAGNGYFDELEADFYSAMRTAYYGPKIEFMDLLPACFEVEERSIYETPEILHLVSGRVVLGMVCLANNIPQSTCSLIDKAESVCMPRSMGVYDIITASSDASGTLDIKPLDTRTNCSDAYKKLELYISGRLVALANRVPPIGRVCDYEKVDNLDKIRVFLCSSDEPSDTPGGPSFPLGTISGLGTVPDEGFCFFYNNVGKKTHVAVNHRTLMVKHIHWYGVGDDVSFCECRCSRARLPPSKFWLFEPRCGMHDIGGWYVETFGKDKKGRTVLSERQWDSFSTGKPLEERLHPAVYLFALAYKTLDREDVKRRKRTIKVIVEAKLSKVLQWCKKLL